MKSDFAKTIFSQKYALYPTQTWEDKCIDVGVHLTMGHAVAHMIARRFIPGGRYLYSAGRERRFLTNCYCLGVHDSREGWAKVLYDSAMCLMSGGGIGINYSDIRPEGSILKGTGGTATGPLALANIINEQARGIVQGGSRRSAVLAVIDSDHQDAAAFVNAKIRTPEQWERKKADYNEPLSFDMTNISIQYREGFMDRLREKDPAAMKQWRDHMAVALQTSDPGWFFPVDGAIYSNACSEFRSDTPGDSCNLGTVFLPHCHSLEQFRDVIWEGVAALMAGRVVGEPATGELGEIGREGNRIGLGLGGIAEWLHARGSGLQVTPELRSYLEVYANETEAAARFWARRMGVPVPKATRAIAPTGTISIVAETTGGIEPIFCKAYKRRYLVDGTKWATQYVIDPAVQRLMAQGIPIEDIPDAYDISFHDRVQFQADIQDWVDMAISSTVNLPAWGTIGNNEARVDEYAAVVARYSGRLRGLTVYADGSIPGQPLERVSLEEALAHQGQVIYEAEENTCKGGTICGI